MERFYCTCRRQVAVGKRGAPARPQGVGMPKGSDSVAVESRRPLMRAQKSVTYERDARNAAFTPLSRTKSRAAATGARAFAAPLRYLVDGTAPTDSPDPICSNQ